MATLDLLQDKLSIPGLVRFEAGPNQMPRVVITAPQAGAELYLHGAHLTHYQPASQAPVLFLSGQSAFDAAHAIRGGVPVIFPWFGPQQGDAAAPAHGFARLKEWTVAAVEKQADGSVSIALELKSDAETQAAAPGVWSLSYRVHIGASLRLELETRNLGETTLCFEAALHSYFKVSDARNVTVEGLADTEYLDKVDNGQRKRQGLEPIRLTGETDRVYLDTEATCIINDPGLGRRIVIAKTGSTATILWNPWSDRAAAMKDLGDEEWTEMLCVESGNVGEQPVTLAAGESQLLSVDISII